tara:strand:+ start:150 stop:584 length:435 start_codon:yes stop_codon:yes gene_type:complete
MSDYRGLHESIQRQEAPTKGSERGFGIVFSVVFIIIGIFPLLDASPVRIWALCLSAVFLFMAFLTPGILKPLNRTWYLFGIMLHKLVNPIVLGILFFFIVLPIALVLRILGKDPLNRRFDSAAKSYWIERDPSDLTPESMRQQF